MENIFFYKAFGLTIKSKIECPELIPIEKQKSIDVSIIFATFPDELADPVQKSVRFQAKFNEFILKVDNVAKFFVKDGSEIVIEPESSEVEERDIRLFLLGSAFGALIHQRGLLPLHGSVVQVGDSCVLFCGNSGTGKSTTANTLLKKGYKLLSDDISVIDLDENGQPFVYSGYPQQKLWKDALKRNKEDLTKLNKIRKVINKYSIPIKENFSNKRLPLKKIYVLSSHNNSEIEMNDVKGLQKFNVLKNQTYRFNFIKGLKNRDKHFKTSGRVCEQIPISIIKRPEGIDSVNDIAKLLVKDFEL